ncbi:WSC domain-containing protein, partial [Triangularia verruculosa]
NPKNPIVIHAGTHGYLYHGCYTETTNIANSTNKRALDGGTNTVLPDTMTVEKCLGFCNKYKFAGLEYSRECWCAQGLSGLSSKVDDKECDTPCDGNSTQACGGALRLTVYITSAAALEKVPLLLSLGVVGVTVLGSVF